MDVEYGSEKMILNWEEKVCTMLALWTFVASAVSAKNQPALMHLALLLLYRALGATGIQLLHADAISW
jgi:hypothetical protein